MSFAFAFITVTAFALALTAPACGGGCVTSPACVSIISFCCLNELIAVLLHVFLNLVDKPFVCLDVGADWIVTELVILQCHQIKHGCEFDLRIKVLMNTIMKLGITDVSGRIASEDSLKLDLVIEAEQRLVGALDVKGVLPVHGDPVPQSCCGERGVVTIACAS